MIIYLLKTVLCSAVFLMLYILFFEKEKMHRFNRFYLLLGIAFSFLIPAITIETTAASLPVRDSISTINNSIDQVTSKQTGIPERNPGHLPNVFSLVYLAITAFLFCRLINNLSRLFYKIKYNRLVPYFNATIVLTQDNLIPHSFLSYIFIDKDEFQKGAIEKEILSHELTHVKQRHSVDILFLELLIIFAWFNPLLFWYRRAIQLNHEFLADEMVVKTFNNAQAYQLLLLEKASRQKSLLLTSRFNYSVTKKRLIMMTKTTSAKIAAIKQIALIPLAGALVFIFCTRTIAQADSVKTPKQRQDKHEQNPPAWVGETIGSTPEGVPQEQLDEYKSIFNKYRTEDKNWARDLLRKISASDKERLETIYKQMSKEQQATQEIAFMRSSPPRPKAIPTKEQLELWRNENIYGVWINNKRVANTLLNNYKNTDFELFFVSRLTENAINYGKHYYQVNLLTKQAYQEYFNEKMATKGSIIGITIVTKKEDSKL